MKQLLVFFSCLVGPAAYAAEFDFRFALKDSATPLIYLQGEAGTEQVILDVCGESGELCTCESQDTSGNVIESTSSSQISLETKGNFLRCAFTQKAGVAKVRVYHGRISSGVLDAQSSISLQQLIGPKLDLNKVRTVFRYSCDMTYLQKEGTTTQSFDCSPQTTSCDPTGDGSKHFCLLQSRKPYHLFADTYSSNFYSKPSDGMYNGGGSGFLCGAQIRKFNCADEDGFPVRAFGLYADPFEAWSVPVSLSPAPDFSPMLVGYAAKPSASHGDCPPGLVKKILWKVAVITSDIFPSHNYASGETSTEVGDPSVPPPPFQIRKLSGGAGGRCDGVSCSVPNSMSFLGAKPDQSYSSQGQAPFCVIPLQMLSGRDR